MSRKKSPLCRRILQSGNDIKIKQLKQIRKVETAPRQIIQGGNVVQLQNFLCNAFDDELGGSLSKLVLYDALEMP